MTWSLGWLVTPFGINGASAAGSRCINHILHQWLGISASTYLDARGPSSGEGTQARVYNTVYCVDEDLAMKVVHVRNIYHFVRISDTPLVMTHPSTRGR